ncbi:MAG: HNH endonuclease [Acidobacteria bacterium]|nr:HNH endonuclease [Acidobacteriota bacterium]
MAHPKHAQVRQRYNYRCGYCGVSEVDTGGELTIDHFQPVSAGGDDRDDNLVYACIRCNQYKSNFFPSPNDLAHGWQVLHPRRDEISAYVREDQQTGALISLTESGRFHMALLQLNRPALVEHRVSQRLAALTAAKQRLLETENAQLRATSAAQETYIARLRQLLGF